MLIPLEVLGVQVELPSPHPVLVMREAEGARRRLAIPIGFPEASAIAAALRGVGYQRPMTHDLFTDVLTTCGITVERAVISSVRQGTYYAHLDLVVGGDHHTVTCRPSDAVALKLRLPGEVPLLVVPEVLNAHGLDTSPGPGGQESETEGSGGGDEAPRATGDDGVLLVGEPHQQGDDDVVGDQR